MIIFPSQVKLAVWTRRSPLADYHNGPSDSEISDVNNSDAIMMADRIHSKTSRIYDGTKYTVCEATWYPAQIQETIFGHLATRSGVEFRDIAYIDAEARSAMIMMSDCGVWREEDLAPGRHDRILLRSIIDVVPFVSNLKFINGLDHTQLMRGDNPNMIFARVEDRGEVCSRVLQIGDLIGFDYSPLNKEKDSRGTFIRFGRSDVFPRLFSEESFRGFIRACRFSDLDDIEKDRIQRGVSTGVDLSDKVILYKGNEEFYVLSILDTVPVR